MIKTPNHACIITSTYPDEQFVERGAFVEQLARGWQQDGVSVDVVAPRSWANRIRAGWRKRQDSSQIAGNRVLYPSYLSVSNGRLLGRDLEQITRRHFIKAALDSTKQLDPPDFFYGQFLMRGGIAAVEAGRRYQRPAIADMGENLVELDSFNREDVRKVLESLDGIACVSEQIAKEIIKRGVNPERVFTHPNTVDLERFKPLDRLKCRMALNLPEEDPIVIFVGYFTQNKGPLRVLDAMNELRDTGVKGVFIGRGPQQIKGENVLHAGPVPNRDLPLWLNAADLFVLPTQFEGNCNAINEAMACGLPIVSSDIPEVRSQVPDDAGILTDPGKPSEIAEAIRYLLENPEKRASMGESSLALQRERSVISRSRKVLEWIRGVV